MKQLINYRIYSEKCATYNPSFMAAVHCTLCQLQNIFSYTGVPFVQMDIVFVNGCFDFKTKGTSNLSVR